MANTYSTHSWISRTWTATISIVTIAVATIAATFTAGIHAVACFCERLTRGLFNAAEIFRRDPQVFGLAVPLVAFVRAKAFLMRLAKRDRPETTPGWRMCPSI